ncbi:Vacuolar protein sorting-associated protein 70 [Entomophthora muscae]|uniref:Vacuolar protein sorting-associated protein 70 n=1 Tax=Entomophthora muscae TaxID=34485 RepID=A0ACC2RVU1_9FUNG|nr:Vacuolar protein sorting-associated protein 70 [Entomophthora muscae]
MPSSSRSRDIAATPLLSSQSRIYSESPSGSRSDAPLLSFSELNAEEPLLSWNRFRDSFSRQKSTSFIISSAIVALIVLGSVVVILFLGLGRIFGLFGNGPNRLYSDPLHAFETVPRVYSLEANLQYLTKQQHIAGKSKGLAEWMETKFKSFGLETETKVYYPYLNYPNERKVAIYEPNELAFEAKLREDVIPEDSTSWKQDSTPTFHGLSANGEVKAEIVYANYGTEEDFATLKRHNVSVHGKVVLARYGKVFRGLKVRSAEKRGAVGVLIYSDPADDGFVKGKVYPEGPFRPGSGVQRGTVQFLSIYPGDPLTPGYAATKDAERIKLEDAESLPKIPSLPLSYDDTAPLLRALAGEGVKAKRLGPEWEGGIDIDYWTGPSEAKVHMINRVQGEITPIYNVIATITGEEEPDREVLIGNHRDAWVFGAVDPSSGTAALLEIAHVLGVLKSRGWRPRRTLKLCSWDAEEYGLIGSTEYVEDNEMELSSKTIAYLNVDMFEGGLMRASGSPLLQDVFEKFAKNISDPSTANRTLYDNWAILSKGQRLTPLGSGSDYTPFFQHLGIASLDLSFKKYSGIYHSNYDSFHYMKKFGDPGFAYHLAMTQLWGKIAVELVDSTILPFNTTRYGYELEHYAKQIQASLQAKSSKRKVSFSEVLASAKEVTRAANALHSQAEVLEKTLKFNSHKSRKSCPKDNKECREALKSINDRLAFLERGLIDPYGNFIWFDFTKPSRHRLASLVQAHSVCSWALGRVIRLYKLY